MEGGGSCSLAATGNSGRTPLKVGLIQKTRHSKKRN
jgi:hypothetical protein